MWRVTWRGLLAHKLRLALSGLAVVLGMAFVTGSFVLGDTMTRTFDDLFSQIEQNTDVVVQREKGLDATGFGGGGREPVPASALTTVRAVPGVAYAEGSVGGYAQLVVCPPGPGESTPQRPPCGDHAETVQNSQAPTLGVSYVANSPVSPLRLVEGRAPRGTDEVAVDSETAGEHDLGIGQPATLQLTDGSRPVTIVGIVRFGTAGGLAGATLTAIDGEVAPRLLGKPGEYDSVDVVGAEHVTSAELLRRIRAALPSGLEAVTGQEAAQQQSDEISDALGFFTTFLLVFAGIALFVGTFIISNTFSILVAQRTRELALLRALGASNRQVTTSVVGEAVAVGMLGSTAGLGLGLLVALGLRRLLDLFGVSLPEGGLVLQTRTVVVTYVVGVVVTLVAALGPARRAGRVPPMAALRDDVALPERSLRRRALAGVALLAAGGTAMAVGLAGGGPALTLVGVGVAVVFLGVRAVSPFLSRPVVRILGAPISWVGSAPARIGRSNAARNPRRSAATASALMIGLALVSTVSVIAASATSSVGTLIDKSIGADLIIQSDRFDGFSNDLAQDVRTVEGVASVTSFRFGRMRLGDAVRDISGVGGPVARALRLDFVAGGPDALARDQILVDEELAKDEGWTVGERLEVEYARTGRSSVVVGGMYERNEIAGNVLLPLDLFAANFTEQRDYVVAISLVPRASFVTVTTAVHELVVDRGDLSLHTRDSFVKERRDQVNQVLGLVLALLALAVFIAALGIVNTLALSVVERTREIGLLRAVGMSRRQVKRMIRVESVIVAVFGAVLGLAVGVGFGIAVVTALGSEGITDLVVPAGRLTVMLVLAGVVGVMAAVLPARRAARLDVLRAISGE